MSKPNWLIILFILTVMPFLVLADQRPQNKSIVNDITIINSHEFDGFEKCNVSNKLSATLDKMINSGNPAKKEKGEWTYKIKSKVIGLPVKAIIIGVCDESGDRACGWGAFLAVIIARPLSEVKNELKAKTGLDFTKQVRDKDTEVTLRPVLVKNNNNESLLFCDPGTL